MSRLRLFAFALLLVGITPTAKAACGGDKRFLKLGTGIKRAVEVGDSWNGIVAIGAVCGGCDYVNRPGGHSDPNYQRAIATINWGDGSPASELTIDPATGNLTGNHTFPPSLPADKKETQASITFGAHCWDTGPAGNWDEFVTSSCISPPASVRGPCEAQDTKFTIYSSVRPKIIVPQGIKLGTINPGGLGVSLEHAAPASGTKITITSNNPNVKFKDADHPFSSTLETRVAEGNSSVDFDVDTQQITTPRQLQITVKTLAGKKTIGLHLPAEARQIQR